MFASLVCRAAPRLLASVGATSAFRTARPQTLFRPACRFMSTDLPSHQIVDFPALSPTMTSGKIVSWSVDVGEEVTAGDVLGEVETDKAVMSFQATDDGFVAKILVEEGTSDIPIGKPVMVVVESADDVGAFADFVAPEFTAPSSDASSAESAEPASTPEPTPAQAAPTSEQKDAAPAKTTAAPAQTFDGARVKASPLAKRLAANAQIALEKVVGTGANGRVTEADVNAYASVAGSVGDGSSAGAVGVVYNDIELSGMRKVIASRLLESKNTIPHYYLNLDVNADAAMKLRADLNSKAADGEYKLSMNDLVIKAASLALTDVKEVNSGWMDTHVRQYETVDISVAVSTDTGLITPIVFNADLKGLSEISNDVRALAAKAREGRLMPEEYQGGTFTISNLGMFGITRFTAIINPPQACILSVGTTQKKVVVDETSESGFGVANVVSVTLSCDHRVVDGAVGAQWLAAFKKYFEDPMKMLL